MEEKNLKSNLEKLSLIVDWFEKQEEVDVEEGLKKVKESAEILKEAKKQFSDIENQFEEIKREIEE